MKLYLAGPMTGYPDSNFPAFNAAADRLRALGHDVINPADTGENPDWAWADYLRLDITFVAAVEAIAVLPGWAESRGASLEVHIAHALGMPVVPIDVWGQA